MASSQGKNGGSSRATWTPELHKVWVDLCLQQVMAGHKTKTTMDRQGWSTMIQEFTRITGKNYSQKQMKNHWDAVKNEWKIFHKLSTYTGSGWDPVNETFTARDDFWEDYLKTYPDAARFRHKGLPHATNLDIIFNGTVAHGDDSWAPNVGVLPEVVPLTQRAWNDGQLDDEFLNKSHTPMDASETMQDVGEPEPTSTHSSRNIPKDISKSNTSSRKKKTTEAVRISRSLERIASAITTARDMRESSRLASMERCMKLLNEIPEMEEGNPLHLFATLQFLKSDFRDLFIAVGTPTIRLKLIKELYERSERE